MPLIRSITKTADGFVVVRSNGQVLTVSSADVPANVKNKPVAQVEAWVNNWLDANNYNAVCRIHSIVPLDIDIAIGNADVDLSTYSWLPNVSI